MKRNFSDYYTLHENEHGYTEAFVNEIEVLKRAKYYMDCMAVGENPITGESFSDDNEITNENFKKCFSYIAGVLDGEISRLYHVRECREFSERRPRRALFFLSDEEKEKVMISPDPVGINTVAARINDVIDQSRMKGVSGGKLAECLVEMGYLSVEEMPGGGRIRTATEKGAAAGIETIDKTDSVGKAYRQNVYSTEMQRFLIENINEIMQTMREHHADPEKVQFDGAAVCASPAEAYTDEPDDDDFYGL